MKSNRDDRQRVESDRNAPGEDTLTNLVIAAQGGDRNAFNSLVEATYVDTYTLALRLSGSPEDAADITQEAYLRALRGLGSFRGDAQFSTWLYRITANCASTYLKRRYRRRADRLDDFDEPVDTNPERQPDDQALHSDFLARVDTATRNLPPKLRAVVVLRDIYDMPHDEIAAELGITVSAAKVRLHRARTQLRAQLLVAPGGDPREL